MDSTPKTRVVLRIRLHEGKGDQYAQAYDLVHRGIVTADGFISSQLCRSLADPDSWIVTSEWRSLDQYLAYLSSEDFKARRVGLRECIVEHESTQYTVVADVKP
ncbi:antibiotic biosynthesis monooxygenase [Streptomyces sp. ME01-24h]|nr:antibiotic biosynthesis monooxygenase [Streptomyces sp. ME19-03-3]MDX3355276.1 antibiotic biosynthesis monooxygenase [Streptomyces sp. ME01-24h]